MGLIALMGIKVLICIPFSREFARTEPDDFDQERARRQAARPVGDRRTQLRLREGQEGIDGTAQEEGQEVRVQGQRRPVRQDGQYDREQQQGQEPPAQEAVARPRACSADSITSAVSSYTGREGSQNPPYADGEHLHGERADPQGGSLRREGIAPGNDVKERTLMRGSVSGGVFDGVMNIGCNPTFGDGPVTCEVHIFDANSDFVGRELRVHFIDRIRDEKKFPGAAELMDQIAADIGDARTIHSRRDDVLYL
ncbi:MAG: hypothetical protein MZV70_65790 [Desulfobacterales bacterium]|nr:hypothetical protein [Desulfobacterales bacterium]